MFSLPNGPELVFIVALALIIFGPKRLPEIGKTIGQGLRELRKASRDITDAFNVENLGLDADIMPSIDAGRAPVADDSGDDVGLESPKENEQDVTVSVDSEWPGTVDHPLDSGASVWSEETAGDRQVDG